MTASSRQQLSVSSADSKTLPPVSKSRSGQGLAPFRVGLGGSTGVQDPDVESAARRKEARVASEKSRQFLEERRRAQEKLREQVTMKFRLVLWSIQTNIEYSPMVWLNTWSWNMQRMYAERLQFG